MPWSMFTIKQKTWAQSCPSYICIRFGKEVMSFSFTLAYKRDYFIQTAVGIKTVVEVEDLRIQPLTSIPYRGEPSDWPDCLSPQNPRIQIRAEQSKSRLGDREPHSCSPPTVERPLSCHEARGERPERIGGERWSQFALGCGLLPKEVFFVRERTRTDPSPQWIFS